MKAILLAAGLGTRLRPLTNSIPKCLVPIKGVPLLQLWLDKLTTLGVTEVLINTHYFHEQVVQFIESYKTNLTIRLVYEEQLLGTGGTLIQNASFWADYDTLVIHADNYCEDSLTDFVHSHSKRPKNCCTSLLLFRTSQPKSCGVVTLDEQSIITSFHEKVENPPSNLASGALFLFDKSVYETYFQTYRKGTFIDLSADVIPNMINCMNGYETKLTYLDIGTLEQYNKVK
ncbi:nucleotidyltransferase family protein [Pseudoalteromonas xiamenensis]|uniref:Nucleotidyltransferase family protein n=1 Tax=Pseudoalteromonas xiamenensis TaxID=882626 RepID=A0A975HKH4_9GAMM|nr:nucleotidyltransferase family protein [Pseudoalteromonas xiamenensis]QTH71036.1 nucleotidyltransferase family protein [Pseudoalteromonas xiamenensis]